MGKIDMEEEVALAEIPETEGWSENYCFDGFDAERNIGFWIHLGRWSLNPMLWREQILIYLPDGTFLLRRSIGARASAQGAAGACLALNCEVPGERWRLQYDGPARHTTTAELAQAPLREAPMMRLRFELTFHGTGEYWDFFPDKSHGGVAFSQHIEQPGRVQGSFRYGESQLLMRGVAYRDHSRGVRNLISLVDHCWIHGQLSTKIAFALFGLRKRKEEVLVPEFEKAVVWFDGQIHEARVERTPYIVSPAQPGDYELTLTSDAGTLELEARILRTLPVSLTTRFEFFDGLCPDFATFNAYEQPTSFWCKGEAGTGHTERSTVR